MTYQPNFNDPRVRARIRHALGFATATMSSSPHEWSTRYIDRYFGQSQNQLSKWLRQRLLIESSPRYNKDTGECKKYQLNDTGVRYLRDILSGANIKFHDWLSTDQTRQHSALSDLIETSDIEETLSHSLYPSVLQVPGSRKNNTIEPADWVIDEYKNELSTLTFTYNDQSHRLWHPLQNVKRSVKRQVFARAGLNYQYDIDCCAPTLIHQYAQKLGMDLYLFAIRKYINERESTRQEISRAAGITTQQAKEVVNALFAGARIGTNPEFDLFLLLDQDSTKINRLRDMPYIIELRQDIKTCWQYIEPTTYRTTRITSSGREVKVPMSSRQKWNIYFECERQVLDSVRRYLDMTGNRYFLEHDGWSCTREIISVRDLHDYILWSSGFDVQVKCEYLFDYNVMHSLYPSVLQVHGQV
jgi:hypothetical protein